MSRLFIAPLLASMTLIALASTAPAAYRYGLARTNVVVSTRYYATQYGTAFRGGVYYRGLHHRHWSARRFDPTWRTWYWYDPSSSAWYYWYAARSSYMPVSVIDTYPPQVGP
jgi:hypothetical protein